MCYICHEQIAICHVALFVHIILNRLKIASLARVVCRISCVIQLL